jgi:hypothetical protein
MEPCSRVFPFGLRLGELAVRKVASERRREGSGGSVPLDAVFPGKTTTGMTGMSSAPPLLGRGVDCRSLILNILGYGVLASNGIGSGHLRGGRSTIN